MQPREKLLTRRLVRRLRPEQGARGRGPPVTRKAPRDGSRSSALSSPKATSTMKGASSASSSMAASASASGSTVESTESRCEGQRDTEARGHARVQSMPDGSISKPACHREGTSPPPTPTTPAAPPTAPPPSPVAEAPDDASRRMMCPLWRGSCTTKASKPSPPLVLPSRSRRRELRSEMRTTSARDSTPRLER